MAKFHTSMHSYRAAQVIVKRMDMSALANLNPDYRRVFSTRQTAAQTGIQGVEDAVGAALVEHNRLAEIASTLNVDEPELGSLQYQSRQKLIAKWRGPLTFQIVCRPHDGGLTVMARFIEAGQVLDVLPLWFTFAPEAPISLPDGVNPTALIEFSVATKSMARLMSSNIWDGNSEVIEIDPRAVETLKKPTEVDPLSLTYSVTLLQISKQTHWNLVARVQDEMAPWLPNERPTLRTALDAVTESTYAWHSQSDGWLVLAPSGLSNYVQIDRKKLEAFIQKCEKRLPTLDAWADLAGGAPAPFSVPLMLPLREGIYEHFWRNRARMASLSVVRRVIAAAKANCTEWRKHSPERPGAVGG